MRSKWRGCPVDDPRLAQARERILELGGIQAANSYVKINLSLFDMYPREYCPSIPPEVMFLPGNFMYQMSAWTRAIVVSLAIVHSSNLRRPVPAGSIWTSFTSLASASDSSPARAFLMAQFLPDRRPFSEILGKARLPIPAPKALKAAEEWMLARCENSDGLGAIYPPMMYAIMALDALGYPADHPASKEARYQFDRLMIDDGKRFLFQPCFSPIWDTGIGGFALGEAQSERRCALRRRCGARPTGFSRKKSA